MCLPICDSVFRLNVVVFVLILFGSSSMAAEPVDLRPLLDPEGKLKELRIQDVVFAPSGEYLAIEYLGESNATQVALLEAVDEKRIQWKRLETFEVDTPIHVTFTHNSQHLVIVTGSPARVRVMRCEKPDEEATIDGPLVDEIREVYFTPDDQTIMLVATYAVYERAFPSGELKNIWRSPGMITGFAFNESGDYVFVNHRQAAEDPRFALDDEDSWLDQEFWQTEVFTRHKGEWLRYRSYASPMGTVIPLGKFSKEGEMCQFLILAPHQVFGGLNTLVYHRHKSNIWGLDYLGQLPSGMGGDTVYLKDRRVLLSWNHQSITHADILKRPFQPQTIPIPAETKLFRIASQGHATVRETADGKWLYEPIEEGHFLYEVLQEYPAGEQPDLPLVDVPVDFPKDTPPAAQMKSEYGDPPFPSYGSDITPSQPRPKELEEADNDTYPAPLGPEQEKFEDTFRLFRPQSRNRAFDPWYQGAEVCPPPRRDLIADQDLEQGLMIEDASRPKLDEIELRLAWLEAEELVRVRTAVERETIHSTRSPWDESEDLARQWNQEDAWVWSVHDAIEWITNDAWSTERYQWAEPIAETAESGADLAVTIHSTTKFGDFDLADQLRQDENLGILSEHQLTAHYDWIDPGYRSAIFSLERESASLRPEVWCIASSWRQPINSCFGAYSYVPDALQYFSSFYGNAVR